VSRRRDLDPAEHALWEEVVRSVKPARGKRVPKSRSEPAPKRDAAKPVGRPVHQPKPPKPPPQPIKGLTPVAPGESMRGVDGATAERLRRGRIAPDATLDLHGMTQDRAYATLMSFIRRHHEQGDRCLLVVTGKGSTKVSESSSRGFAMPERSRAGVLRTVVPHWLNESDVRAMVVGVQSAHQRHGGSGALYIYLRRKRQR
jgi:DNA-nicking Smr family endonuclease